MNSYKQVIIIPREHKMGRGKEIAQGAHASRLFLVEALKPENRSIDKEQTPKIELSCKELEWLRSERRTICLQIPTVHEMYEIHHLAIWAGLKSRINIDAGLTMFKGKPTPTACAIGPDTDDVINKVTGDLLLY